MSDHITISREKRTIIGPGGPINLYVFRPNIDGALPLLLYFPGGGFISYVGGLQDLGDGLARAGACIVVIVEYRLAPAHVFPAAHDDCLAALNYCAGNAISLGGNPEFLAVGGDSAGGTLAASLTFFSREGKAPYLRFQFLAYPLMAGEADTESRRKFAVALSAMVGGWRAYAAESRAKQDPLLQPLIIKTLIGLPPTLIVTVERDPLRDEGEIYAARLKQAGVPVMHYRYAGGTHGFLT